MGSPFFEEAYFVVRRGGDVDFGEEDIVKEATRIADQRCKQYKTGKGKKKKLKAVFFLYGAALSSFLFGLAMFFILLAAI